MIIAYNSDYVRYIGSRNRDTYSTWIELRNLIQYEILGDMELRQYLGPYANELEMMVRRINDEGMLLDDDIRELYSLADRVEGLNGGGGVMRPPWFNGAAFASFGGGAVFTGGAYLRSLYINRASLASIGATVYGGGTRSRRFGRPEAGDADAAQRAATLLGEGPGGPGFQGEALD